MAVDFLVDRPKQILHHTRAPRANIPAEQFVREAEEFQPQVLGLSALLTTTMSEMRKVIETIEKKGLRNSIKILVGGAPVNQKFADDIGADGYARDAGEAVDVARSLVATDD